MDKKQPKVINKSGTTRLTDEAAAAREAKAQNEFRGRRRDNRRGRRAAEEGIINRVCSVSRTDIGERHANIHHPSRLVKPSGLIADNVRNSRKGRERDS